ncbi:hypothetical protein L1887_60394 [Cichorium endivia]|nr:hypothetical protein L1887_60394 [Cichorium endivia]
MKQSKSKTPIRQTVGATRHKLNRDIQKTNTFCKVTDSLALARKIMENESQQTQGEAGIQRVVRQASRLRVILASDEELLNHESRLDLVQKKGGSCLWRA